LTQFSGVTFVVSCLFSALENKSAVVFCGAVVKHILCSKCNHRGVGWKSCSPWN